MSPLYLLLIIYKVFHPNCKLIVTFHGSDINELHNKYLIWLYSKWLSKNDVAITVGHILKIRAEKLLGITIDHVLSAGDRKSTRLNSSHVAISYAVFCLKKKKKE